MSSKIRLVVGGYGYGGWKSVRVTRTMESIAGSFALDVTDRWGAAHEPRPIAEEDECTVEIDDTTVINGYVDKRSLSATKDSRTLSYTGRDRAAALVDNSLVLSQWTFKKLTLAEFATRIAQPFGVKVSVQAGLVLKARAKIVVNPGDTGYDVLAREAPEDGVMLVSDGAGGIVVTRAGKSRATSLVEGENIHTASVDYDGAERFSRYAIATQTAGTDEAAGNATRIRANGSDEAVRRTDRVLLIRPSKGCNAADAKRRADWEARIRAARAETVTINVLGWKQPSGVLWPVNALVYVKATRMVGVDGEMLISQVEHSIAESGQITQLRLVRPDAFSPEPQAAKVKASGGLWKKEFSTGAAIDLLTGIGKGGIR